MPIYEYLCKECGYHYELIQKFNDQPVTQCPNCQANSLQKQVSAPSFHLKGSGWYVTDFKDSDKKRKVVEDASVSEKSGSTEVKSDSTSAKETESKKTTKEVKDQ